MSNKTAIFNSLPIVFDNLPNYIKDIPTQINSQNPTAVVQTVDKYQVYAEDCYQSSQSTSAVYGAPSTNTINHTHTFSRDKIVTLNVGFDGGHSLTVAVIEIYLNGTLTRSYTIWNTTVATGGYPPFYYNINALDNTIITEPTTVTVRIIAYIPAGWGGTYGFYSKIDAFRIRN